MPRYQKKMLQFMARQYFLLRTHNALMALGKIYASFVSLRVTTQNVTIDLLTRLSDHIVYKLGAPPTHLKSP